jgi:hypothetical protein
MESAFEVAFRRLVEAPASPQSALLGRLRVDGHACRAQLSALVDAEDALSHLSVTLATDSRALQQQLQLALPLLAMLCQSAGVPWPQAQAYVLRGKGDMLDSLLASCEAKEAWEGTDVPVSGSQRVYTGQQRPQLPAMGGSAAAAWRAPAIPTPTKRSTPAVYLRRGGGYSKLDFGLEDAGSAMDARALEGWQTDGVGTADEAATTSGSAESAQGYLNNADVAAPLAAGSAAVAQAPLLAQAAALAPLDRQAAQIASGSGIDVSRWTVRGTLPDYFRAPSRPRALPMSPRTSAPAASTSPRSGSGGGGAVLTSSAAGGRSAAAQRDRSPLPLPQQQQQAQQQRQPLKHESVSRKQPASPTPRGGLTGGLTADAAEGALSWLQARLEDAAGKLASSQATVGHPSAGPLSPTQQLLERVQSMRERLAAAQLAGGAGSASSGAAPSAAISAAASAATPEQAPLVARAPPAREPSLSAGAAQRALSPAFSQLTAAAELQDVLADFLHRNGASGNGASGNGASGDGGSGGASTGGVASGGPASQAPLPEGRDTTSALPAYPRGQQRNEPPSPAAVPGPAGDSPSAAAAPAFPSAAAVAPAAAVVGVMPVSLTAAAPTGEATGGSPMRELMLLLQRNLEVRTGDAAAGAAAGAPSGAAAGAAAGPVRGVPQSSAQPHDGWSTPYATTNPAALLSFQQGPLLRELPHPPLGGALPVWPQSPIERLAAFLDTTARPAAASNSRDALDVRLLATLAAGGHSGAASAAVMGLGAAAPASPPRVLPRLVSSLPGAAAARAAADASSAGDASGGISPPRSAAAGVAALRSPPATPSSLRRTVSWATTPTVHEFDVDAGVAAAAAGATKRQRDDSDRAAASAVGAGDRADAAVVQTPLRVRSYAPSTGVAEAATGALESSTARLTSSTWPSEGGVANTASASSAGGASARSGEVQSDRAAALGTESAVVPGSGADLLRRMLARTSSRSDGLAV